MTPIADILSRLPTEHQQQPITTPADENKTADNANTIPTQAVYIDPSRLNQLTSALHAMRDQLDAVLRLLSGEKISSQAFTQPDTAILETGERVIEGVFNGEKMVGPDGKEYAVPPNYASKSKLVEGDLLKLTITNRGAFIFKQIGPIKRKRIVGELVANESGAWHVLSNGRTYRILTASVTFYKGKPGEEAVMLVPEDGESAWGAVENIIHI